MLSLKNFNSDLTWMSHVEPRFRMKNLSQDRKWAKKKSNARKLVLGIMRNHLLNISTARTNMPGASKEYAPPKNKDRGKIYKVL